MSKYLIFIKYWIYSYRIIPKMGEKTANLSCLQIENLSNFLKKLIIIKIKFLNDKNEESY